MNPAFSTLHFLNRELSWLEFNERVLEEAQDTNNPLFERLKFLSIVGSNLDEFFMIRVASLQGNVEANYVKIDPSGLTPTEQIERISARTHRQVFDMYNCFNRSLKKSLKKADIHFIKIKELNNFQLNFLRDYYANNVFPVLTPMVVNKNQPFPLILNKTLNISLLLGDITNPENLLFGTIQVPSVLNRLVEIPSSERHKSFILLEEIIKLNLSTLFDNHTVIATGCYRITRDAFLDVSEDESEDLLTAVELSLKQRKWGSAIRLEIEHGINPLLLQILEEELEISAEAEYKISGPIDLTFLMKLSGLKGYDSLRYDPIKPNIHPTLLDEDDIFQSISKQDILLHHPYDSFDMIVNLVKTAAEDPNVLAIKQTLYRVSGNSPIIEALAQAADNGKQVTVLLELQARFDEQNNITWAKKLETAGCHVIYGLVGLKAHCKILLIVRREDGLIKRYVHLGTGNYNDVTAKLYTDLGLLTANPYFGADASAIFNTLSGCSSPSALYKMTLAPMNLRNKFLDLIHKETEYAKAGKKAKIIAKLNSLVDTEIIKALYNASSAGVTIELIVRGICCLRPKIPFISEHITVRSIVGRFLEHSRIYYFYGDGEELIFLASADLMRRNLDKRVELLFPIEDPAARTKVRNVLDLALLDTSKSRVLNLDGTYSKIDKRGKDSINSQEIFLAPKLSETTPYEVRANFVPIISVKDIDS
ncbi:RNA degradosome polyphosphate kinase [Desulfosporosinus fructosivorans]|uniref:Polyphosphate kinase n=1 Tax=Desulfosporosinus fructosivorans TaxID=2018669 RepID=A0A4Z0R2K1_9FIRM|nr:RNA degradosome polyphosphate kinase [Desulfosporosinus fructosivorans]TGE36363.1 RNA degradosome polyphosphate kinase [Desulfosporosinus fructosivorans]